MKIISFVLALFVLASCNSKSKTGHQKEKQSLYNFDLEGHRGTRGLMPENTLPAFKKAMDLGVNTLEMDVVITKDSLVLVSHDPWFNYHICLDSVGKPIEAKDSMRYAIYHMTYAETQLFDCGSLGNPNFPDQKKMEVHKPLLKDVLTYCENYMKGRGDNICYNIEIKSDPRGDNLFHPVPDEYCRLVTSVIKQYVPLSRVLVQSFDFRILEQMHLQYPEFKLAALVESGSAEANLSKLSFKPDVYSPWFVLLSQNEIGLMKQEGIKVVPWTVNDSTDMKRLLSWKVDGLITDYPNVALKYKEI
nr:glycerophosphodiester phosphodiesterase family protein [uncultured Carboxylicivirga sp.]